MNSNLVSPASHSSTQFQIRPSTIRSLSEELAKMDRAKRCINVVEGVMSSRQKEVTP